MNAWRISMKIVICDDDKRDREHLFSELKDIFSLKRIQADIDLFETAEQLMKQKNKYHYDVYFLDIYMKEIDGIQLAKTINQHQEHAAIVLTTSSKHHYADGFDIGAVHYLVKPCSTQEIDKAVTRCLKLISTEDQYLEVLVDREKKKILYSQINVIESQNRYCVIHTVNAQYRTYQQLNDIEEELNDARFLRCHRSYLINLDYVHDYHNGIFFLKDSIEIPVKRGDRKLLKKYYEDYCFEKMRRQFKENGS